MASDPKYVRLREGVSVLADVYGSGWRITGNAVLPFPDSPLAQNYVRTKLHAGALEPAGKAEYEETLGGASEADTGDSVASEVSQEGEEKPSPRKSKAKAQ